jgi:hypothetical protein
MNKDQDGKDEIKISAPWGQHNIGYIIRHSDDSESTKHFIQERSKVHSTYIIEQEKTKRLSLILSVILLLSALLILVFAPEGREQISYWIGGALLLFSAGAAGYKRIWAKAPLLEVDASDSDPNA